MPTSFIMGHLWIFGLSFVYRMEPMLVAGGSCINKVILQRDRRFVTIECMHLVPLPTILEISCRVADSNRQR